MVNKLIFFNKKIPLFYLNRFRQKQAILLRLY